MEGREDVSDFGYVVDREDETALNLAELVRHAGEACAVEHRLPVHGSFNLMDDRIEVTLSSPAKVDLRVLMAGVQSVSAEELHHLQEAGVVVTVGPVTEEVVVSPHVDTVFDQAAFDAAVAAEAEKLAGQIFDGALGKLEDEVKDLIATAEKEKAEFLARIDETGKLLTAERQKSADLAEKLTAAEADIVTLKAAPPPSVNTPVAKTASRKGAATS